MGFRAVGSGDGDGTGDSTGEGWSAVADVEPSGSDVDVGGIVGWGPASPVPQLVVSGAPAFGFVNAGELGVEAALPHATISINIAAPASGQADMARKRLTTFPPFFSTDEPL